MLKFPFAEKKIFGNVSCSSDVFGNVARESSKQCFCAIESPALKVERCGTEREHSECLGSGFVYYGREVINGFNPATFDQVLRDGYVKKESHGSLVCSNAAMGSDPAPGKPK